ncbi:MAG: hypothetical protein A2452_07040 [Candidatus Firestonebacteria bacterium RIFOXYC2_FULL_39_67]|nr:MAG: hypothetical protein A2536_04700 [Candidatus Firestonebacteria bacterium RIFOXYD2_FULL_39_29]OGF52044.1 MAG: hypothetical protein A2497_03355 [Candidatus Firestonebacteria bacterium RifOxyC12_full_39_7]OGF54813.1 MAG: hypothetical protein A2452_07040 [Candidatus Firestonebacteria bacterium RIFOXYC2_FULL_39_67]
MKAERFEDLNIYKEARVLAKDIYEISRLPGFEKDFYLVGQIRRSAVSIMSNIAEGFERKGDKEFSQFLFIAKGSCGELRAQMDIIMDQGYVKDAPYKSIRNKSEKLNSMISNLIKYLRVK